MLGLVDDIEISPNTQTKTGTHSLGFYAQDSWKVTRRLTVDYGLRYDFQTYLKEQYGRMPIASFTAINPTVGASWELRSTAPPATAIFRITIPGLSGRASGQPTRSTRRLCCAPAPALRMAWCRPPGRSIQPGRLLYLQLDSVTGSAPIPEWSSNNNPVPNVTWPNYNPGKLPIPTAGLLPPSSPNTIFNPSARPPRTLAVEHWHPARIAKRHRRGSYVCGQPGSLVVRGRPRPVPM